jgi:hypothetical protein
MPTPRGDDLMNESIDDKDLQDAMAEVRREHPSLQERLDLYRDRRSSYDAKRLRRATATSTPTRQGARRQLRG